jgi:hypothetical protein
MSGDPTPEQLAALTALHAATRVPPEGTIAKLPKPTKRDNQKGRCSECGGYHGLPAVHIDYMGHAEIREALLRSDPAWDWAPLAYDADGLPKVYTRNGQMVMWIELTVHGVTRRGVGTATATKEEVDKELIGDALRNAAMSFGVAVSLWSKAEGLERTIEDGTARGDTDHDPAADGAPTNGAGNRPTGTWTREGIRDMTVKDLTAALTAHGLALDGSKDARMKRLWSAVSTGPVDPAPTPPPTPDAAPTGEQATPDAPSVPDPGLPLPEVIADMPKRALVPLLTEAKLSTSGTVGAMRERLVDHYYPAAPEGGTPPSADTPPEDDTPSPDPDFNDEATPEMVAILKDEMGKMSPGAARAYMTWKRTKNLPDPDGMNAGEVIAALEFLEAAMAPAGS